MKNKNAAGTVSFIFIAILLSKLLGLLRGSAVANFYGTESVAGAYAMASQLPVNFFDMILGSAISSALIPVYNKFISRSGMKRANLFASRFLNIIIIATVILSVLGIVFSRQIIYIMGSKLDEETASLAAQLLRIMFPLVIFTGMAFTLVGILQSLGEFKIPAVMSLISNALCIIYLLTLNEKFGIYGLSSALLIGWAMQFLILVYPAKKRGFSYSLKAGVKDEGIKEVVRLALPALLATWVQPINTMVNMNLASGFDNGSGVAVLDYANKLYIIAASAFAMAVTNYIFPKLSQLGIDKDTKEWGKVVGGSIKALLLIVIPIMLVFLIGGREIIKIVYERGEFGAKSVDLTTNAMFFYSFGMIWYGLQEILNKAFYSVMDTKTPMICAVGGIVTNVALCIVLSQFMGVSGLALSASVSAFIWSIFGLAKILKIAGRPKNLQLPKIIAMGIVFAAVMFAVRFLMLKYVGNSGFIRSVLTLAASGAAALLAYAVAAYILKIDEVMKFFKRRETD